MVTTVVVSKAHPKRTLSMHGILGNPESVPVSGPDPGAGKGRGIIGLSCRWLRARFSC